MDRSTTNQPSLIASLTLAMTISLFSCSPRPAFENILVVSVDTLSRSSLRAFNPQATPLPALDRFASESIRFTNAYTAASWTLPAHISLFTGL